MQRNIQLSLYLQQLHLFIYTQLQKKRTTYMYCSQKYQSAIAMLFVDISPEILYATF